MVNSRYRHLLTPIKIGPVTVPNRVVLSAHLTNYAYNGLPTEQHVAYYRRRAVGGAGLIITEEHSVHTNDWPYEKMIHGFRPEVVPWYRKITDAVHREGTPIFAQINHNGAQGTSAYSREPLWGPSPIMDPLFREVPVACDQRQIAEVIHSYATVARHVADGGFDGIELQCSHSSIVRQFLSPLTNHRNDGYGGTLENRVRLLLEIVRAVREEIGNALALGVRICGDEMVEGGTGITDAIGVAQFVEATGKVDYINTSIGIATASLYAIEASMAIPPGYADFIPAAIRGAVSLPVIGVGRYKDPLQAESALASGVCDLVGMVRAQIADPDLVRKTKEGREEDIRTCLSCNQECVGRMGLNRWLGCIENTEAGRESLTPIGRPTKRSPSRRCLIIGAGPAGLQAAISSARRGHLVSIVERGLNVGGKIVGASRAPGRAELYELIRNQIRELRSLGVAVQTGAALSDDDVVGASPDLVVLATGSVPKLPYWVTSHRHRPDTHELGVADVTDVSSGEVTPSGRVVLFDETGFHGGSSTALLLAERGCNVTVVTPHLSVAQELGVTLDLESWHLMADRAAVSVVPRTLVTEVSDTTLTLVDHVTGTTSTIEADWLVLSVFGHPFDPYAGNLERRGLEVVRIGDALAPRRIHQGILEGDRVGGLLDGAQRTPSRRS